MPTYFFFLGTNPALSAVEAYVVLRQGVVEPEIITVTQSYLHLKINQAARRSSPFKGEVFAGSIRAGLMLEEAAPPRLLNRPFIPTLTRGDLRPAINGELNQVFLNRLGGTDRIAELITEWEHLPSAEEILKALQPLPEKWMLGISVQGVSVPLKRLAIDLKKAARSKGSRLKFVLPKGPLPRLNSAQVIFNKLTVHPNAELTLLSMDSRTVLARTIAVQDIAAYEQRDTARPARDTKVGMLPPKLAQIMLNIAASHLPAGQADQPQKDSYTILDPFCGMGTILQEGWLLGHRMFGGDVSRTIIEASASNLQWLAQRFDTDPETKPQMIEHDARQPFPAAWNSTFDAIVTEPYLGKALHASLSKQQAQQYLDHVQAMHLSFFRHASPLLRSQGVILFLFPAVKTQDGTWTTVEEATIDEIARCGYDLVQLVPKELVKQYPPTKRGTLLYSRPDALVARELTLWKKRS